MMMRMTKMRSKAELVRKEARAKVKKLMQGKLLALVRRMIWLHPIELLSPIKMTSMSK